MILLGSETSWLVYLGSTAKHFWSKEDFSANIQGVFFLTGPPSKKLKYGKPRLGEVMCIKDVLDTPNLA